jgi:ribosomal protein L13
LELLAVILVAVNNMIPWGLLGQGVKSGLEIYKNKKAADVAMSEAKLHSHRKNETWRNRI